MTHPLLYTTPCVFCRRRIEIWSEAGAGVRWPGDVTTARGGYACVRCAMEDQARDDRRRWSDSRRRGETPAGKCLREAREWEEASREWREGLSRGRKK